jgi:hypothetical protein
MLNSQLRAQSQLLGRSNNPLTAYPSVCLTAHLAAPAKSRRSVRSVGLWLTGALLPLAAWVSCAQPAMAEPSKGISNPSIDIAQSSFTIAQADLPTLPSREITAQRTEALPSLSLPNAPIPSSARPSSLPITGAVWTLPAVPVTGSDGFGSSERSPNIEVRVTPAGTDTPSLNEPLRNSFPLQTRVRIEDRGFSRSDVVSTVCTYRANGVNSASPEQYGLLTVVEVSSLGDTLFLYQVLSPSDAFGRRGDGAANGDVVVLERRLLLANTSLAQARRQLVNNRRQYAQLLGLDVTAAAVRQGFGPVNRLLACQEGGNADGSLSPRAEGFVSGTVANLADGNYRFTSGRYPVDVNQAVLQSNGDRVFTFRKTGDAIVGNFDDFHGNLSACIVGRVSGNSVTGQAYTPTTGNIVLGQTYLDSGLALLLSEEARSATYYDNAVYDNAVYDNAVYDNAVLNLSGFSRINAGSTIPPTGC